MSFALNKNKMSIKISSTFAKSLASENSSENICMPLFLKRTATCLTIPQKTHNRKSHNSWQITAAENPGVGKTVGLRKTKWER